MPALRQHKKPRNMGSPRAELIRKELDSPFLWLLSPVLHIYSRKIVVPALPSKLSNWTGGAV